MAQVELDLFSGRPNPTWELDDRAAQELPQLIGSLFPTRVPPSDPPGLGYRGFRLCLGDRSYRVWGTHVFTPDDHRADPHRAVETFLLDHLPAEHSHLRGLVDAQRAAG